jgi:hypothetical protein
MIQQINPFYLQHVPQGMVSFKQGGDNSFAKAPFSQPQQSGASGMFSTLTSAMRGFGMAANAFGSMGEKTMQYSSPSFTPQQMPIQQSSQPDYTQMLKQMMALYGRR